MKTICFFNSTNTWGGGEKWHFEMALALQNKNIPVLFVVAKKSVLQHKLYSIPIMVENIEVKNLSYLNLNKIINLKIIFKKYAIETVIMNSSQDMKLCSLVASISGVKNIIYRRGSAIDVKNTSINRYFFKRKLTAILANSKATKQAIIANNPNMFPYDKIEVIPNGIHIDKFLKKKVTSVFKGTQKDKFVLGNLARLEHQKNHTFLIDVAYMLKQEGISFTMLIGGDGSLKESLIKKAKSLGVEDELVFLGFIEEPKAFMESIDVFLLPSHWEGFGYVIAQAMLCEKPVVAFDISSNPELIENKVSGYLTPYQDIRSFTDKIIEFYKRPMLIKKMGQSGKRKICSEFNFDLALSRFLDYLSKIAQ